MIKGHDEHMMGFAISLIYSYIFFMYRTSAFAYKYLHFFIDKKNPTPMLLTRLILDTVGNQSYIILFTCFRRHLLFTSRNWMRRHLKNLNGVRGTRGLRVMDVWRLFIGIMFCNKSYMFCCDKIYVRPLECYFLCSVSSLLRSSGS